MNLLSRKKIYILGFITIFLFSLYFIVMYIYNLGFRVISYDKRVSSYDSYVDIRFNKKITNIDQIAKLFSVDNNQQFTLSSFKNDSVLRFSSSNELNSGDSYTITIPRVESNDKYLNDLSFTFEITNDDSGDNEFDGNKGAIYDNNLKKYTFMNGGDEIQKDAFFITMQNSTSHNPSFLVTLTPDIQDYSNQESKNQYYLQAFSDFEKYISTYGFKVEDLSIKVSPEYISSLVLKNHKNSSEEVHGD